MNHNNWIKKDRAEILKGFSEVGSIGAKLIKESFEGAKLVNVFCRDKGSYENGEIARQNEFILEFDNGQMLGIGNPDMARYVNDLFYWPIVEAAHGLQPVERADLLCPISSDQTGLSVGENPVIARFSYSVRAGQEVFKDLKAEVKVLFTDQEFAWLSQQNLLAREEGIEYPIYSL